jgi:hypothetical protein
MHERKEVDIYVRLPPGLNGELAWSNHQSLRSGDNLPNAQIDVAVVAQDQTQAAAITNGD